MPLSVGQQLVWTPSAAADTAHGGLTYIDQGASVACVTSAGLNAAADKVRAPEHLAAACGQRLSRRELSAARSPRLTRV